MGGSASPDPATGPYWSTHLWRRTALRRFGFVHGDGRDRLWRLIFPGLWLLYLIPVVNGAFEHHRYGALYLVGAIAITVVFAGIFIVVLGLWDRYPWLTLPGFGLLFALAVLACACYGKGATPLWIYVAVAGGMAIGRQWLALRILALVVATYAFISLTDHMTTGGFLGVLLPLLFGGLAALGFRARSELTGELMRARETVAQLAASEERLRLARDMHDLTGQSLSMITLKSDLAARVLSRLPASPERDRAAAEMAEVADVSRQALADIREAISGYRRPTLAVEAITAWSVLDAAGITAHDDSELTLLSGTFDADAEATLAWCLREAVTNVVRHSGARNCWVTLKRAPGELTLRVRDDGRGSGVGGEAAVAGGSSDGHTGLHGMSERLTAAGGRLEISPGTAAARGFDLAATVAVTQAASRRTRGARAATT
jgi:two-component system sensor histidine kinase DesK